MNKDKKVPTIQEWSKSFEGPQEEVPRELREIADSMRKQSAEYLTTQDIFVDVHDDLNRITINFPFSAIQSLFPELMNEDISYIVTSVDSIIRQKPYPENLFEVKKFIDVITLQNALYLAIKQ